MKGNRPYLASFQHKSPLTNLEQKPEGFHSYLSPIMNNLEGKVRDFQTVNLKKLNPQTDHTRDHMQMLHAKCPANHVMRNIKESKYTDITIQVNDTEYLCHNIVLGIYSKRLRQTLTGQPQIHYKTSRLSTKGFELIYKWMVSQSANFRAKDCVEMLRAATFLEVPELIEQCWNILDTRLFSEFSAFSVMLEARCAHELVELHEVMSGRISKAFMMIISSREFLCLSEKQVCSLFKSSNLAVNSEIEVLFACLLWLDHQWPLRRKSVVTVISNIRFGYLPPTILSKFKTKDRCKISPFGHILDVLYEWPQLSKLIQDGLFFSSIVITTYKDPKLFEETLRRNHAHRIAPRRWMRDLLCEYHKEVCRLSPNMHYLNFKDCAKYLKSLQSCDGQFDKFIFYAEDVGQNALPDWRPLRCESPYQLNMDLYSLHMSRYGKSETELEKGEGGEKRNRTTEKQKAMSKVKWTTSAVSRNWEERLKKANGWVTDSTQSESDG